MTSLATISILPDPKMPFLTEALSPLTMQPALKKALQGELKLHAITLLRHKPGRRCLIQYDLSLKQRSGCWKALSILGKARAKGLDKRSYHTQQALWERGFSDRSPDCVSVPEPLGLVPEVELWLQPKIQGISLASLLEQPQTPLLMSHVAEALYKLHQSSLPSSRRHSLQDELRLLDERLNLVARQRPAWAKRLERVMTACERLAETIPKVTPRGIHRDFYQDQILFARSRLYLFDFDLYALGDPALDVGNFLGHLTELAVRIGNAERLLGYEQVFEDSYVKLVGEDIRSSIQAFKTLTLARHIFISTQFAERQMFTESLLELCEKRLA